VGEPKSHLLPSLAVAACGAIWGIFWIPVRWFEDQGVGGGWIGLVFSIVCLLAPLPWLSKKEAWANLRHEALSGFLLGSGFALYTVSLVLTDVVNSILLFYLAPIWSSLATWAILGYRFTLFRVIAIIGGLLGMALILGAKGGAPVPQNLGDWLALLAGILWSFGGLNSFSRPSQNISLPVFCFAGGSILTSTIALIFASGTPLPLTETQGLATAWPMMVPIALFIFVLPNFLVLWASQRMEPGRVSVLLMTEALVGSVSAALLSGETMGPWKLAGAALIIAAALLEIMGRPAQATR
jgi:drug/metabolite transporter (DMT)-like permease